MIMLFASPKSPAPLLDDERPHDEGEQIREEIASTLTALMPWGISILAHVGLIALAFFLVWQTVVHEQPRKPTAGQLTAAPQVKSFEVFEKSVEVESSGSPAFVPEVVNNPRPEPVRPGVGEVVMPPQPDPGIGIKGKADGLGVGDQTRLFDLPPGDPPGGDPASRFVIIVDASGSMVDVLPFVVNELKRMVSALDGSEQEVTVLFFSGEGVFEAPGGDRKAGLRSPTPAYKERFREWVALDSHQFPTGGRGSLFVRQALETGLKYKPEVIYLLSDHLTGGGQGATLHEIFQDDLMDLIRDNNNATSPARINTIQFLYEDPLVRQGLKGTLQLIADETGGQYKFLSERDLKLR